MRAKSRAELTLTKELERAREMRRRTRADDPILPTMPPPPPHAAYDLEARIGPEPFSLEEVEARAAARAAAEETDRLSRIEQMAAREDHRRL